MTDRDRTHRRREGDRGQLKARLEALAGQSKSLRAATVSAVEGAAESCSAAARIHAHSRALRGAVLRVRLPRAPSCGASARRFLEGYLDGCPDAVVSDAKTVATELVNNAYRHGGGVIELKVERHDRHIRIDVADEGPTGAERVQRSEGSRGLEIVEALSLCWGAYAGSTHVWAELPIEPGKIDPTDPELTSRAGA